MSKKKLAIIITACIIVIIVIVVIATHLPESEGTSITLDDSASIFLPTGAVSPDASVNATILAPENGPELPEGFTIETLYEFSVDEPLMEPVVLRLPLASVADNSVLWLAKYDETSGAWHGVEFTIEDGYAVVQTDTLSIFGTIKGTWDDFSNWAIETRGSVYSWVRNEILPRLTVDYWISWYEEATGLDEMIYEPLFSNSPELKCDDSASAGLISTSAQLVSEGRIEIRIRNDTKMYLQLYFEGPSVEPVRGGYITLADMLEQLDPTPQLRILIQDSFLTDSIILIPESTADFRAYLSEGETLRVRAELSDAAALLNGLDPVFALVPLADLEVVTAVRDVKGAESDFYQAFVDYEVEWLTKTYYGLSLVEETLRTGWLLGTKGLETIANVALSGVPAVTALADKSLERAEDIMDKGSDAISGGTIVISYQEETTTAQYDLTISSTVGGSVPIPGEGTFSYDSGTVVDLVASPASGYTFDGWSGSASGTAPTLTVTMDSDKYITAHFELEVAPGLVDISPEELVATIYKNDLTSLQRDELWKDYVGKGVRWTGTLRQMWSIEDYPGFSAFGIGWDWVLRLEEGSIIVVFDDGIVYDEHPYINCRTRIEIHVAFDEESKPTLLGLARGSAIMFEGTISDDLYMSGGDSICASLGACIHLTDGAIVGDA